MNNYLDIVVNSYSGYFNYLVGEVSAPSWGNYFYYLIAVSFFVWLLEYCFPGNRTQKFLRKGIWLDTFYMFFNFFLFSLVGYNAISNVGVEAFNWVLANFNIENLVAFEVQSWPVWLHIFAIFIVADFVQWLVHVTLHHVPWLWQFHKVHHSVVEMGYAAHLRFHWMETIVYKTILYIPLTILGFGLQELFLLHAFTILVGHLNHANINVSYGVLRFVFNNPRMHIWHHAKALPVNHPKGVNFGLTLSVWDYIFKTAYVPEAPRYPELGFPAIEDYPQTFFKQMIEPFKHVKFISRS